jgi:hypothetical protein
MHDDYMREVKRIALGDDETSTARDRPSALNTLYQLELAKLWQHYEDHLKEHPDKLAGLLDQAPSGIAPAGGCLSATLDGTPRDEAVNPTRFRLRAERSNSGIGRVYSLTYRATDDCGDGLVRDTEVRCHCGSPGVHVHVGEADREDDEPDDRPWEKGRRHDDERTTQVAASAAPSGAPRPPRGDRTDEEENDPATIASKPVKWSPEALHVEEVVGRWHADSDGERAEGHRRDRPQAGA